MPDFQFQRAQIATSFPGLFPPASISKGKALGTRLLKSFRSFNDYRGKTNAPRSNGTNSGVGAVWGLRFRGLCFRDTLSHSSLLRSRFLGCHAMLHPKKLWVEHCVTSQKTAAGRLISQLFSAISFHILPICGLFNNLVPRAFSLAWERGFYSKHHKALCDLFKTAQKCAVVGVISIIMIRSKNRKLLNRAAVGWAVSCSAFGIFGIFF